MDGIEYIEIAKIYDFVAAAKVEIGSKAKFIMFRVL